MWTNERSTSQFGQQGFFFILGRRKSGVAFWVTLLSLLTSCAWTPSPALGCAWNLNPNRWIPDSWTVHSPENRQQVGQSWFWATIKLRRDSPVPFSMLLSVRCDPYLTNKLRIPLRNSFPALYTLFFGFRSKVKHVWLDNQHSGHHWRQRHKSEGNLLFGFDVVDQQCDGHNNEHHEDTQNDDDDCKEKKSVHAGVGKILYIL